ncbi:magnesium/cobalt efflux protein, partial [Pseudomonas aeruginosa]|nr:magnesium/cobalt efflux protein [Pseudomonas aeruginosa]
MSEDRSSNGHKSWLDKITHCLLYTSDAADEL